MSERQGGDPLHEQAQISCGISVDKGIEEFILWLLQHNCQTTCSCEDHDAWCADGTEYGCGLAGPIVWVEMSHQSIVFLARKAWGYDISTDYWWTKGCFSEREETIGLYLPKYSMDELMARIKEDEKHGSQ